MNTLRGELRDLVLAARAGDGSTLLRDDMPLCQPEASAGIIADAMIDAVLAPLFDLFPDNLASDGGPGIWIAEHDPVHNTIGRSMSNSERVMSRDAAYRVFGAVVKMRADGLAKAEG